MIVIIINFRPWIKSMACVNPSVNQTNLSPYFSPMISLIKRIRFRLTGTCCCFKSSICR